MAGQHLAAQHEAPGAPLVGRIGGRLGALVGGEGCPVDHVGAHAGAVRAEGDGEADLGHAVARDEGLAIEAHALERLGEAVEHVGPDHVAADSGVAPAREVEIGRQLVGGAAGGEVVAEARAVGDGAAVARDQVQPLRRPAREVARRQIIDRELARERRHGEADQAHVVIERQPAHGAIARHHVEPGRARHAGEIGHQRALRDLHAVRMARAARRELDVAEVGRAQRPQIDRLLRQRLERGQAAMKADSRELPGGVGQEAGEIVDADGRHRARRRELAAQLIEIGLLAADPDGDRDRHGQQAGILGAEEDVEEAGPGVGRDQDPIAHGKARADQAAGGDMGALADLAPGEGRENLAPDIIKGDPGLAPRRIVQHLGHRFVIGPAQGELGIAGRQRVHGKAGCPTSSSSPPLGGEAG